MMRNVKPGTSRNTEILAVPSTPSRVSGLKNSMVLWDAEMQGSWEALPGLSRLVSKTHPRSIAALKAPSVHTLHPEAWIAACSLGFCGWRGSRAHNFLLPAPQQQPPPRALQEMAAALPAPPPHRSRCQRAPGPPPRGRGGHADCKELIGQGWSQAYGLHANFQFNKESVSRSLKLEP